MADHVAERRRRGLVGGAAAGRAAERRDAAGVDDALDAGLGGGEQQRAGAVDVGAVHRRRARHPQPIVGGDVEQRAAARDRAGEARRVVEVAHGRLERQVRRQPAGAPRPDQRAHRSPRGDQRPRDRRADEAARAGDQRRQPACGARALGAALVPRRRRHTPVLRGAHGFARGQQVAKRPEREQRARAVVEIGERADRGARAERCRLALDQLRLVADHERDVAGAVPAQDLETALPQAVAGEAPQRLGRLRAGRVEAPPDARREQACLHAVRSCSGPARRSTSASRLGRTTSVQISWYSAANAAPFYPKVAMKIEFRYSSHQKSLNSASATAP